VSCHRKVRGFELSGRKSLCSLSMSVFAQKFHSFRTMHAFHRIPILSSECYMLFGSGQEIRTVGKSHLKLPWIFHLLMSFPPLDTPQFEVIRHQQNEFPPLTSISSTLPSLDGPSPPQSRPQCPQCKGQKYGFEAYFHNINIFPEPPHALLPWVERSYILKNRLQSLLVSYTVQQFERSYLQDIEIDINNWRLQVEAFAHEVASWGSGSERVVNAVKEVHQWSKTMVKQLWDHVVGNQMLPMPKGRVKEKLLEFRKGWEKVWVTSAEHQRQFMVSQGTGGFSC